MGACFHKLKNTEPEFEKSAEIPTELRIEEQFGLGKIFSAIRLLGEGGSGETWLMRETATHDLVAVKLIRRPIPRPLHQMLLQEIKIQRDLGEGHINIVNFREVVLTPTHLAFVLEYVPGGTLTKFVSDRWETAHERNGLFLTEEEARFIFKQFLSALEYIHYHKVAHRDLKLDNTLLDENDPPCIKICDFGFSKNFDESSNMHTQIGTPVYMSPEVISCRRGNLGYDGQKADIWATGVLLFVMLLGMFPYEHSEHPDPNTSAAQIEVWLQQIKSKWRENGRIRDAAKRLSSECQDLLDHIFELDERRRMSIENIQSHPWFSIPMSTKYEMAWKKCQKIQSEITTEVAKYTSHTNDERNQSLQALISKCSVIGQNEDEVERMSMTRIDKSFKFDQEAI
eukprot:g7099.t1